MSDLIRRFYYWLLLIFLRVKYFIKFFKRREHYHILKLVDMATGHADHSTYLTGWRWQCVLCGKIIDEHTESALELLDAGRKSAVVFTWMYKRARKKESE